MIDSTSGNALSHLKVVELGEAIAARYATRLMALQGADVVQIALGSERPSDALSTYLDSEKHRAEFSPGDGAAFAKFLAVIDTADLIVESLGTAGLAKIGVTVDELMKRKAGLVVLSVSPFGLTGPYQDFKATELNLQAWSGQMHFAGDPEGSPLQLGYAASQYTAGQSAYAAALAALLDPSSTGHHIDLAVLDVAMTGMNASQARYSYSRCIGRRGGGEGSPEEHLIAASDGLVMASVPAAEKQRAALLAVTGTALASSSDELTIDALRAWIGGQPKAEVMRCGQAAHLPWGALFDLENLLRAPHLLERGFFMTTGSDDAAVRLPGLPFRLKPGKRNPANEVGNRNAPDARPDGAGGRKLFEGLKILSLTNFWAGPSAARYFADHGAEVIKIETIKRPDPSRGTKMGNAARRDYPEDRPAPDAWNRVARFNERHLGNIGITLDLASAEGKSHFRELVRQSDILIENFSPRVMASLGVPYEQLCEVRPDLIMLSMPGFGCGGEWGDYISFGFTLELIGGLAALTGYDLGDAYLSGVVLPDFVAAQHGAGALLSALHVRNKTGSGCHIELSQLESMLCLVGEQFVETQQTGRAPRPLGNRHAVHAPHGCYPTNQGDAWVTIAVTSEQEWRALCEVVGEPALAGDPRFAVREARKLHEAELDARIGDWTQLHDKFEVAHMLQNAGVAAAPVMDARDQLGDPHVAARDMLVTVDHSSAGPRVYAGSPWRISGFDPAVYRPAPLLGEHNDFVFGEKLGLSAPEINALRSQRIIGEEPL